MEGESPTLRQIISDIWSALFDSFKKDVKEEMRKEMDQQLTEISSENCMFGKKILKLKQANVKLQNEFDELKQCGRRSFIRIDDIPEVFNESSEDDFNNIVMFVRTGIEQNIDRTHYIGKSYHLKISEKSVRA